MHTMQLPQSQSLLEMLMLQTSWKLKNVYADIIQRTSNTRSEFHITIVSSFLLFPTRCAFLLPFWATTPIYDEQLNSVLFFAIKDNAAAYFNILVKHSICSEHCGQNLWSTVSSTNLWWGESQPEVHEDRQNLHPVMSRAPLSALRFRPGVVEEIQSNSAM